MFCVKLIQGERRAHLLYNVFADTLKKEGHPMELTVSVAEVAELIKEIQERPARIFEMTRLNVQEEVGRYLISRRLIGRNISHQEVSKANKDLTEAVERWRGRDLSNEAIKYLYVDGVIFSMRV